MTTEDTPAATPAARAHLDRAAEECAAAVALLQDRRVSPASAVGHLLDGWRWLVAVAGAPPPSPEQLAERLETGPLPDLQPDSVERLRSALPRLRDAASARGEGRSIALKRRELLRLARELAETVRAERRGGGRSLVRRAWPLAAGAAALASALLVWRLLGGAGADHGWRGAYYQDADLGGSPTIRTSEELVHDWQYRAPLLGFPSDGFSARYDSCLSLEQPTQVRFSIGSDDGSRFFVEGKKHVDRWRVQDIHWEYRVLDLDAGVHHLRVDYFEKTGRANIAVWASLEGSDEEPLPAESFLLPSGPLDAADPCEAHR